MKLEDALTGTGYALNEITGELVQQTRTPIRGGSETKTKTKTLIAGDAGPTAVLCALLFDEEHVRENWGPLSLAEVDRRMWAHQNKSHTLTNLAGDFVCERIG